MADEYTSILYEKSEGIAWITLNRPEKLNALNYVIRHELRSALENVAADDAVRVAVIRAAGRAFSAGADLTFGQPAADDPNDYDNRDIAYLFYECIWKNPKPIIAAVHGNTLARGGDMASFCDITIAADDAVFGYPILWQSPHVQPGLWPWTIGFKLTKELTMTGRLMDAQEALTHGLVNRVVPRDQLEEETDKLARLLANAAEKTTQKRMLNDCYELYMGMGNFFNSVVQPKRTGRYGENDPVNSTFRRMIKEDGLKAALAWREARMQGKAPLPSDNF